MKFILLLQFCLLQWSKSQQGYSTLNALTDLLKESDEHYKQQLVDRDLAEDEYDFIVVGAGTAGCVVASRLAEITEWKILLIEAGSDELFYMDIPINVANLQHTAIDWQYRTAPSNNYCLGYDNHQCYIPRGKVIGGSSILNYMISTRGNVQDYDEWAEQGNPGWEYKNVLPFFKKAENMTIPQLKNDRKYHNTGGPVTISELSYPTILGKAFLEAGKELGYEVGDYNGAKQSVFSLFQFTQKDGRRESTSRSYLYPAAHAYSNLHIIKNAIVTQLIIKNGAVDGVKYIKNNRTYITTARKEVILSAGAINSPQLLILSGIGPAEELTHLGIPVQKILPVGYNLQDHVSFGSLNFITNVSRSSLNATCLGNQPQYLNEYAKKRPSPYATPGSNEGIFFFNTTDEKNDFPDIEIHFSTVTPIPEQDVREIGSEVYNAVFKPIEKYTQFGVQCILAKPRSRGKIYLESKDPFAKPIIQPNYFERQEDVETLLRCIDKAFAIANTKVMKKFNATMNPYPVPQCKGFKYLSADYWRCVMKVVTFTNYHQSGTCKMGPAENVDSVVNDRLCVHGISKLRVIDSSIMPSVPTAHTNIPTIMIAEKGVHMIKEDYGRGFISY